MMITATPTILTASLNDILKDINKKAVNYQKSVILQNIDNIKKQGSVPTKHCIKLINPNQRYLYFCSPEILKSSYHGTPSATTYTPVAPTSIFSPDTVTHIPSPIPHTPSNSLNQSPVPSPTCNQYYDIINGKVQFHNWHYQPKKNNNSQQESI